MQNHDLSDKQVDGNSSEQTLSDDADDTTAPLPPPQMQVIRSAGPLASVSIGEAQPLETLSEQYQPTMNWSLEDEYAAAVLPFQSAATSSQSPYAQPLSLEAPVPAPSPAAGAQSSPTVKRNGGNVAMLGGILTLVAFFLPWFIVLSSCQGEVAVGPANNPSPFSLVYLIAAIASILLSLVIIKSRASRRPLWAGILHLNLTIVGLLNFLLMSLLMAVALKSVLIGFWMALAGFATSLYGSIRMLADMLRQPGR